MNTDLKQLPAGASVWETDLYEMLTHHVSAERVMLEEYVETARSTGSNALTYLVDLLVEDERRHHRIWQDLAESLRTDAELIGAAPVIPYPDFGRFNAEQVIEITKRLLDSERQDLRELKRVRKALDTVDTTTMWALLVDIMELDTRKHIVILRDANRRAKAARH